MQDLFFALIACLLISGTSAVADINECLTGHGCHANAKCTNLPGTYSCTCNTGYVGPGHQCTDVNECSGSPCHAKATCINTDGSYTCNCNDGYSGDGTTCTDINECNENIDNCHHNATCLNGIGSFSCLCKTGFSGNGVTCKDVDECTSNASLCMEENEVCVNTMGSFECTCKTGFYGTNCSDIDECAQDAHNCSLNATCSNTNGSFTCQCISGFTGNGAECHDIDECATTEAHCDSSALCQNSPGSFQCNCKPGFHGDGKTCVKSLPALGGCPSECEWNTYCSGNTCICKQGFTEHSITKICTAYCPGIQINGNTFKQSFVGETVLSNEICHNGRSKAKVVCTKNAMNASFDIQTYSYIPCKLTLEEALNQGIKQDNLSIANQTALIQLLSIGVNLTETQHNAINNYLKKLSQEVNKAEINISSNTLSNVVQTINYLANSSKSSNSNSSVIHSLQTIAVHVKLSADVHATTIETENVAVAITRPPREGNRFNDTFYTMNTTARNKKGYIQPVYVEIPAEAYEIANQTSNIVQAFISVIKDGNQNHSEQWIASVDVGIKNNIKSLKRSVNITFHTLNKTRKVTFLPGNLEALHEKRTCVYEDTKGKTQQTDGVCLVKGTSTCRTTHLTSFSILLSHAKLPTDVSLSAITIIGCALSVIGLVATIVVHLSVKQIRSLQQTHIFLHLCVVLGLFYLLFVFGIGQTKSKLICTGTSVALHYLLLSSWFWMAIYSHCLYSLFAMSLNRYSKWYETVACIVGYGVPLIILAGSVGYSSTIENDTEDPGYCKSSDEMPPFFMHIHYRSTNKCWVQGNALTFGVIIPCAILLLFNCVIFALLMKKILGRRLAMRKSTANKSLKREFTIAVTMVVMMGMSWIFGYLSLISTNVAYQSIMSWLFGIFSSLQGLLIFLLTAVRRAELRNVWYRPLHSGLSTLVRPMSRFGSRIGPQAKSDNHVVSTKTSQLETPSSLPGISSDFGGATNGETGVESHITLKGKSESFGTVHYKTNTEEGNHTYLYPDGVSRIQKTY